MRLGKVSLPLARYNAFPHACMRLIVSNTNHSILVRTRGDPLRRGCLATREPQWLLLRINQVELKPNGILLGEEAWPLRSSNAFYTSIVAFALRRQGLFLRETGWPPRKGVVLGKVACPLWSSNGFQYETLTFNWKRRLIVGDASWPRRHANRP